MATTRFSLPPPSERPPSAKSRKRQWAAAGLSLGAHAAALLILLWVRPDPPKFPEPDPPLDIVMVNEPVPAPKPAPPAPPAPKPAPAQPAPKKPAHAHQSKARPSPARPTLDSLAAGSADAPDSGMELSATQIAGAASAGSGGGGGPCDMARRIQTALRKDPLVIAAVAASGGKALLVWNGDWVQGNREDGKGLAAVREAILWEVGFAPPECRAQPVRGLVLMSLGERGGSAKLALGTGAWRWSDLLATRRSY